VEREALAFGLSPEVKLPSAKQEWNRRFGVFLRFPDFRRFSGTVEFGSAIAHSEQPVANWQDVGVKVLGCWQTNGSLH
jgi:hypothetical protein